MARQVKCQGCGDKFTKDDTTKNYEKTSKGYYHLECYESIRFEQNQYKDLMIYICNEYRIKEPTQKILVQAKRFKTQNNYSYGAMKLTLEYGFVTGKAKRNVDFGLSIIPYIYDEAKAYWLAEEVRKNKAETMEKVEYQTKVVKTATKTYKKRVKEIDMTQF